MADCPRRDHCQTECRVDKPESQPLQSRRRARQEMNRRLILPDCYTSTVISKKTQELATEEVPPIASTGPGMANSGVPSAVTEGGNGRPLVVWKAAPQEAAPIVRVTPPSEPRSRVEWLN